MTDITADGTPGAVPTAEEEATGAPAVDRRARPPWAAIAAAVLGVAAVALAALWMDARADLAAERDDRRDAERAAGELAAALLTYDYRDLDASRDRVLARATGTFKKEYEEAFETGLRELLSQTKATSEATIKEVYLSQQSETEASALVVANTIADGTAGRRATLDSYIRLDLLKVGGAWLVDGVTNLNFGQQVGGDGAPATPATPAPPNG